MDERELSRELELTGFSMLLDERQPVWRAETWREREDEYPVFPCRTIEVTDEIRAADVRQREEREAARRASITWKSPVAASIREGGQATLAGGKGAARKQKNPLRGGAGAGSAERKQPAVYLFPTNRMHGRRREVA